MIKGYKRNRIAIRLPKEATNTQIPEDVLVKLRTCVDGLLVDHGLSSVGPALTIVVAEAAFHNMLAGADPNKFFTIHNICLKRYLDFLVQEAIRIEKEKVKDGADTKQTS